MNNLASNVWAFFECENKLERERAREKKKV